MCQLFLLIGIVSITQILCLTVKPLDVRDGNRFTLRAAEAGLSLVLGG